MSRLPEFVRHHLDRGTPVREYAGELRAGRRGSLSVRLDDGRWYDFETGFSGGPFALVGHLAGTRSFEDTLRTVAAFVGGGVGPAPSRVRPVRAVVLYVGDHDPAGVLIDQALESELRRHLHVALDFRRLAINPDQIAAYDLPTKPRKAGARRRLDVEVTVEAEAMPAATMRALVWDAVEGYLPGGALEVARMSEEAAQHRLRRLGESVGAHGLDAFLI